MLLRNVFRRASAAVLIAAAVSACGGGGGGGSTGPVVDSLPVPCAQADASIAELNKPATLSVLSNDSISNGGTLVWRA